VAIRRRVQGRIRRADLFETGSERPVSYGPGGVARPDYGQSCIADSM
jgi:hypothetical protein